MKYLYFFALGLTVLINLPNGSDSLLFAGIGASAMHAKPKAQPVCSARKIHHSTRMDFNQQAMFNRTATEPIPRQARITPTPAYAPLAQTAPTLINIAAVAPSHDFDDTQFEVEMEHSESIEIISNTGQLFCVPRSIFKMSLYYLETDRSDAIDRLFMGLNNDVVESLIQAMTFMYKAFKAEKEEQSRRLFFVSEFNPYILHKIITVIQRENAIIENGTQRDRTQPLLFFAELIMAMNILKIGIKLDGTAQICLIDVFKNVTMTHSIQTFMLFLSPEFNDLCHILTTRSPSDLREIFIQQMAVICQNIAIVAGFMLETTEGSYCLTLSTIVDSTKIRMAFPNFKITNITILRFFMHFLAQYNITTVSYREKFESSEKCHALGELLQLFKNTITHIILDDKRLIEHFESTKFFQQFNTLKKITFVENECLIEWPLSS